MKRLVIDLTEPDNADKGVEIPVCPITKDPMKDPVLTMDGFTYEKSAISKWFESHDTSPMTNKTLSSKALVPNFALRAVMESMGAKLDPPTINQPTPPPVRSQTRTPRRPQAGTPRRRPVQLNTTVRIVSGRRAGSIGVVESYTSYDSLYTVTLGSGTVVFLRRNMFDVVVQVPAA